MEWRKDPEVWRCYPYVVQVSAGETKWSITWHHQTAGVSSRLPGRYRNLTDAISAAEVHGEENGWTPRRSRGHPHPTAPAI